jgi:hypothetical protein
MSLGSVTKSLARTAASSLAGPSAGESMKVGSGSAAVTGSSRAERPLMAHTPRRRAEPKWVRFRGIAVASRWVARTAHGDN